MWFHLKLPPSRPPSPPNFCKLPCHLVSARAVFDLLSSLTQADADNETTHLIRETVSDACDGLLRLMEFVQMSMIHDTEELARELGALTADLLTLIVLSYLHKCTRVQERGCRPRSNSPREGDITWGVSLIRQGLRVYHGRWSESARRAHEPSWVLV